MCGWEVQGLKAMTYVPRRRASGDPCLALCVPRPSGSSLLVGLMLLALLGRALCVPGRGLATPSPDTAGLGSGRVEDKLMWNAD